MLPLATAHTDFRAVRPIQAVITWQQLMLISTFQIAVQSIQAHYSSYRLATADAVFLDAAVLDLFFSRLRFCRHLELIVFSKCWTRLVLQPRTSVNQSVKII
ncbi:hypothetical protein NDU88_001804 [Pleurodeles waltl]|uniref:Uncharacterized protein n=1 Tax=Pleurodeles waltl TaxID=8319 RepID=A0AAV7WNU3_PLEWA|nr:hypothetical protein NDU88_001804 [Pleurodeles waltl]